VPRKNRNRESKKRLEPAIVVALIGLAGTIIAALLASPLPESWLAQRPTASIEPVPDSQQATGNQIGLNQTVTGTLYYNEAGTWLFSEGPATVTIILDVSTFGTGLIIVRDPSGVDRAYVDEQSPGVARLVNFQIPTSEEYTILVRNTRNTQVDYTLTVQDALTPP
jgi:hypothetical protein